jgi:adenylosuccinate lyase
MRVWQSGQSFQTLIGSRDEVKKLLSAEELKVLFDPRRGLKNVDYIFKQVGLE